MLLSLSGMKVHAFEKDGIYYNITSAGSTVEVAQASYVGDVTIPSTVTYEGTTYKVTKIGKRAFKNCSGLTSITIPNSITYIGEAAFYDCI